MARGRLAQPVLPDKGQVGIGAVPPDCGAGKLQRLRGRRDVGIEIFQAQHIGAGVVCEGTHAVDADTGDMRKAGGTVSGHGYLWQQIL